MFRNVIFLVISFYIRLYRVRNGWKWLNWAHQGEIRILSESLSLRSTFARVIPDLHKVSNYLSFSSLLFFLKSSIISGPFTPPDPGQSDARPELKATKGRVVVLTVFFLIGWKFLWLYNIPDAHTNVRGQTSSLPPSYYMWKPRLLACHLRNLRGPSTVKTPASCLH